MTGSLSGIGNRQTALPFGTTFQPGGKNQTDQNTRQNNQTQQTQPQENVNRTERVQSREAVNINETRNETYAPQGEIETRVTGDRGGIVDITV